MQDSKISKEAIGELWHKGVSISGDRLKKVLETLKWDLETFQAAYRREISGKDAKEELRPEQIEAVTRFEEDGNYDNLLAGLGTSHPLIADSVVSCVIVHRNMSH